MNIESKEYALNILIKGTDTNQISDGYHTFGELYEHRIILYIALCKQVNHTSIMYSNVPLAWRSKLHSDGTSFEGWFLLGIAKAKGHQITYHLPEKYWNMLEGIEILDKAPEFDGHTSADVLERLKEYFI